MSSSPIFLKPKPNYSYLPPQQKVSWGPPDPDLGNPSWDAQSDFGLQDLTSALGTPRRGFQGPDQVDPVRPFVGEGKRSNLVLVTRKSDSVTYCVSYGPICHHMSLRANPGGSRSGQTRSVPW